MSDDRDDRILSPDAIDEDGAEVSLRPQTLDEFIGQLNICENLQISYIFVKFLPKSCPFPRNLEQKLPSGFEKRANLPPKKND